MAAEGIFLDLLSKRVNVALVVRKEGNEEGRKNQRPQHLQGRDEALRRRLDEGPRMALFADLVMEPEDGGLVRAGVHGRRAHFTHETTRTPPQKGEALLVEGPEELSQQCRERGDQGSGLARRLARHLPGPQGLRPSGSSSRQTTPRPTVA